MKLKELKEYCNKTNCSDDDEVMIRIYEHNQIIDYPIESIDLDDEEIDKIFLASSE